jgi:FeS assembly SUF system regulator
MIRLTKVTDYGIVLMTHIATHGERLSHNAPELAVETGLPSPMVSKVLKTLVRGGLLLSHRGVKGGYSLARGPRQITVRDIVMALEGPIAITECLEHASPDCNIESLCPVRSNWSKINQAVEKALDEITLEDMAQPLPDRFVTFATPR